MSPIVDSVPLWFAQANCYVVAADTGGPGVIVDAPPDVDGIAALLARHDLYPAALLVTHGHVDHVGGSEAVASRWQLTAHLHPEDEWLAADPTAQLRSLFGGGPPGLFDGIGAPERFARLEHGSVLDLAGLEIEVVHTPGHTPGHCCFRLVDENLLFSGDHLFAGSIGRTDLPGGDYGLLMRSMRDRILPLPPETTVLPGHGPATTLAAERASNPFLQPLR